jgi:thiol-disulfide isomerase/thioredoxin
MVKNSNFDTVMGAGDHFKNRASVKNHTSRCKLIKNKLFLSMCILLSLFAVSTFGQTTSSEHIKLEVLDCPQSFAELLKKFEGRVIYIDLMGSRCNPCIAELKEAKKLESYFKKNNIVSLFITLDKRETVENALKMIQNESLSGYFVSWHPKNELDIIGFQHDLIELFFKYEGGQTIIAVPRYAIVNRKGELVRKNAARPSEPVTLKAQLEKYLR